MTHRSTLQASRLVHVIPDLRNVVLKMPPLGHVPSISGQVSVQMREGERELMPERSAKLNCSGGRS